MRKAVGLSVLLAACGGGTAGAPDGGPRNVIVISIDTLRRDAVGFHGCEPSPTPNLDALAASAVVFEDAYTVAPVTLPAHASLLTGLYPLAHGVRDNAANRVPQAAQPLAELLAARGYRCRAAVASFVLNESFGLDQGFEAYSAPPRGGGKVELAVADRRADEMVTRAIADVEELAAAGAPFFYWLHVYDPHAPYAAPASTSDALRTRYEDEVRFVDHELGRLFARLRALELWDGLTLVVTSDHGEGLEDGREESHGYFVFDQTMRIPLVLKSPGLAPARVGGAVSLVDVAPTLLELAGVAAPAAGFDGMSLVPAIRAGGAPRGRALAIETFLPYVSHGWAPFEGAVRDEHKLIRSKAIELYDRSVDPAEARDLYRAEDAVSKGMLAELRRLFEEPERRLAREALELDADDLAQIAALGYSGEARRVGDEGALDFASLPDTYERFPLAEKLWALGEKTAAGQIGDAIAGLREVLAADPGNAYALTRLAELLLLDSQAAIRNVHEAEPLLLRALASRPEDATIHWNLARVAKVRADGHKREIEQAHRAGADEEAQTAMALWREQTERFHRELQTVVALEPSHVKALFMLAIARIEDAEAAVRAGDVAAARKSFDLALAGLKRLEEIAPRDDPARSSYTKVAADVQARLASLPR